MAMLRLIMRFGATEDTEVAAATGRISRKLQQGEGRFWGGVVCVYVRARVCASLSVCLAVCLSVSPFSPPPFSLSLSHPPPPAQSPEEDGGGDAEERHEHIAARLEGQTQHHQSRWDGNAVTWQNKRWRRNAMHNSGRSE